MSITEQIIGLIAFLIIFGGGGYAVYRVYMARKKKKKESEG